MHPCPARFDTTYWDEYTLQQRRGQLQGQLAAVIQAVMREMEQARAKSTVLEEVDHLEAVVRRAADVLIELGHMGPSIQAMTTILQDIISTTPDPETQRALVEFLRPIQGEGWRRATPIQVDLQPADTIPGGPVPSGPPLVPTGFA